MDGRLPAITVGFDAKLNSRPNESAKVGAGGGLKETLLTRVSTWREDKGRGHRAGRCIRSYLHPEELHLVGTVVRLAEPGRRGSDAARHGRVDDPVAEAGLGHLGLQLGELVRAALCRREQARLPRGDDGLEEHGPRLAVVREVRADEHLVRRRERAAIARLGLAP
eukprot:scaffold18597_cov63-Phaeocystis_antarctica.AAC.6